MRISEWSSDVCSSDLKYINYKIPPPEYLVHDDFEIMSLIVINRHPNTAVLGEQFAKQLQPRPYHGQLLAMLQIIVIMLKGRPRIKIGRASCRERVCQYVYISVFAVSLKKKHKK